MLGPLAPNCNSNFVILHLDSCFDYVMCKGKTRTATKPPSSLLTILPGCPVIKLKHKTLNLTTPCGCNGCRWKKFWLYSTASLTRATQQADREIFWFTAGWYNHVTAWDLQNSKALTYAASSQTASKGEFYLSWPSQHCLNTIYRRCIDFKKEEFHWL